MKKSRLFQKIAALTLALGLVLSLLIAVVGFVPITAQPVSAETVTETGIKDSEDTDEYFDFAPGASVKVLPTTHLRFVLQQPSAFFNDTFTFIGTRSVLKLTLYKYNGANGLNSAKYEILIYSERRSYNVFYERSYVSVCAREIEYDSELNISSIEITKQLADEDVEYRSDFANAKKFNVSGYKNFKVLYQGFRLTPSEGKDKPHTNPFEFVMSGGIPVLNISFPVSGIKSSYFVRAEYEVDYGQVLKSDKSGSLTSPRRSVFDVLSSIENDGEMEQNFKTPEELAEAQALLAAGKAPTEITLNYLEDIDGTYFSEMKSTKIAVPVKGGTISIDDVKDALGKETLKVQNTYVKGFTANDNKTEFTAQYLSSVWLRTKAVDGGGHYINMFLDLNKSYGDYFTTLATTIVNGQGLYEYMWNGFTELYPELEGKDPDKVHGFFGVVWIPKRLALSSFDAAMASLFNVKNEEFGFVKHFKGEQEISYSEHQALMREYSYGWISTLWDESLFAVQGELPTAEYYFFAARPMEYTGISQTGNTDPEDDDGAGGELIEGAIEGIGDFFGGIFGVGGNAIKRLSSAVVLVALGFGGWYVYKKFFRKDDGTRK